MKAVLCLALVLVATRAEYCKQTSDCKLENCTGNTRKYCYNYDNSHVCTCIPTSGTGSGSSGSQKCGTQDECVAAHRTESCSGNRQWHCYDGSCVCGYFG